MRTCSCRPAASETCCTTPSSRPTPRATAFEGRVDARVLTAVGPPPAHAPRVFVCGPTAFVERVADLLVGLGHDPATIHAERFGPTGG